ncbi:hypothetical protein RF55_10034, partial [Lasius niger]
CSVTWVTEFAINLSWDESIPQELYCKWKDYQVSLKSLNDLKIPRRIRNLHSSKKIDIHGFSDASERAYGACLYAVTRDKDGKLSCHLICAKTRVTPLKVLTVAKLELCAALLLARLYKSVHEAFGNRINDIHLWTDSTIVIGWIRTYPSTLKTFVANRVSEIQALGLQELWHHVSSAENPADILSRGATVEELKNRDLWWHGPKWLRGGAWPEQPESVIELPEKKATINLVAITEPANVLPDVSSFTKLCRIVTYCCRFTKKCRKEAISGLTLTVPELEQAEIIVIKLVQKEVFAQELGCLQTNRPIKNNSKLRMLDPFLNNKGLICVGGRLRHARISEGAKHPMILPGKHRITRLIFKAEHIRLHHCGPEQLLTSIRQKYWILSGRREARRITRSCLNCFRLHPSGARVKMGDIPEARIAGFLRPFAVSGVDYAGPLKIRESRRRGRAHISKAYVAVFVCFNTKAVHLELITDLTTEAFLAALRRFTGRRGICSHLYSDNATNFVGASRELKDIYEFLESAKHQHTSGFGQSEN